MLCENPQPSPHLERKPASDRRSACPGLFRMTDALDGGICRVKLGLGQLRSQQARIVGNIAATFGNGIVEMTIRANLQIRGIRPDNRLEVIDKLIDAGLGPLVAEGDDVRNVMVSPTAGIDSGMLVDTRPLASKLLESLQLSPAYHALSPKFSLLIDGGEACAVVAHQSDIWLSAMPDGAHYAFGLGSSPATGKALGLVTLENAYSVVTAILDLFLEMSAQADDVSRMKHLLAREQADAFITVLQSRCAFAIIPALQWQRALVEPGTHLGLHQQKQDGLVFAGAAPLLGRLSPDHLHALAAIADEANGGRLHLTPWQTIVVPDIAASHGQAVLASLHALGFSSDENMPTARIRACAGSSGCQAALADTQSDGRHLAQLLVDSKSPSLHLTGCAKSCASINPAPVTLLARAPQRYDLFLHDSAGPSRFGRLLASDITIEDAATLLKTCGASF